MEQLDYELVEKAEAGLDAFIADRVRKAEKEKQVAEAWAESVKEYNRKRAEERRQEWAEFHRSQIARHRATFDVLIERHEKQLAALEAEGEEA